MTEALTSEELKSDNLVLFVGRVMKVVPIPMGDPDADRYFSSGSRTTFAVERHWENDMGSEVVVESGFPGGGCGFVFENGKEYVVFASRLEKNALTTSICTRTTRLEMARPLVDEVDRLIGESKLPEPAFEEQLWRAAQCEGNIFETYRHLESSQFAGRVMVRADNDVFPGAVVAIRERGGKEIRKSKSGEDGSFEIADLQNGVYEFVACAPGMDPDRGWITITPRSDVREIQLFLRLGV